MATSGHGCRKYAERRGAPGGALARPGIITSIAGGFDRLAVACLKTDKMPGLVQYVSAASRVWVTPGSGLVVRPRTSM
jgi:hypothetical protein